MEPDLFVKVTLKRTLELQKTAPESAKKSGISCWEELFYSYFGVQV